MPTFTGEATDIEQSLDEQERTGVQAEKLYDNPIIQEFLRDTETALLAGIKGSRPDEYEKREDLCKMIKMLDSFKSMLVHYLERGKSASRMLADIRDGKFDGI